MLCFRPSRTTGDIHGLLDSSITLCSVISLIIFFTYLHFADGSLFGCWRIGCTSLVLILGITTLVQPFNPLSPPKMSWKLPTRFSTIILCSTVKLLLEDSSEASNLEYFITAPPLLVRTQHTTEATGTHIPNLVPFLMVVMIVLTFINRISVSYLALIRTLPFSTVRPILL